MMKSCLTFLAAALVAFATGCAPKAVMFHETAKVGFNTQYQPDSSQPVNVTLGFKRRIVAIVPSKDVEEASPQKEVSVTNAAGREQRILLPKGEALSMVSRFDVVAHAREGVAITNYFATGRAATLLTTGSQSAEGVQNLLTAPATLQALDPQLQSRRVALSRKLQGLDEPKAAAWLAHAGGAPSSGSARDSMQDMIKNAQSAVAVEKLEAAWARLP